MRVLVCGGRDYDDSRCCFDALDEVKARGELDIIISGGARGADQLAERYAELEGIPIEVYPADWEKYGKSAGFKRNVQMLQEGRPDLVIAFPGGKGTEMMKSLARNTGVKVMEIKDNGDN